jgi:hypothetical protein
MRNRVGDAFTVPALSHRFKQSDLIHGPAEPP